MTILVTGSSGHLGEALMRTFRAAGTAALGVDERAGAFTDVTGSLVDRDVARKLMPGVAAVIHTATLHKPHVATHARQQFVDVNITATLNLLEEARRAAVQAFVFTSTTSAFGLALTDGEGGPATWITEDVTPVPKNIYGTTKTAAEDLCQLFAQDHGVPCVVLRTSRFFPEADDSPARRARFAPDNLKFNELLHRRVDIEDAVQAHALAVRHARTLGFGKFIVSATTPFRPDDCEALARDARSLIEKMYPTLAEELRRRAWHMYERIDRVYVNAKARQQLGWAPKYDFAHALACLRENQPFTSELTRQVGSKGYHYDEHPPP